MRFGSDVAAAEKASMLAEKGMSFAFVEGALVKAVREGWWLLLDEINLAPAEVCILAFFGQILHCCMSCLLSMRIIFCLCCASS